VVAYSPLVKFIAGRTASGLPSHVEEADLISYGLLGLIGASVMFIGSRQIMAGTLSLGGFVMFTTFLAFLGAPIFQIVGIGTQISEALAGLERTREVMRERPEDEDPRRAHRYIDECVAKWRSSMSISAEAGKPVLRDVSFLSGPGTSPRWSGRRVRRPSRPDAAFPLSQKALCASMESTSRPTRFLPPHSWA
jgi:ABC-type multidrug transport system fused ATPase/permease subunit